MWRTWIKLVADTLLWGFVALVAFALRLDGRIPVEAWPYAAFGLVPKIAAVALFGLHTHSWRNVCVQDLRRLVIAVGCVTCLLGTVVVFTGGSTVPRSIPLIEGTLAIVALGGIRLARRLQTEAARGQRKREPGKRILIVGAGHTGTMIAREIQRSHLQALRPLGYLDDDPAKRRQSFAGYRVLGTIPELPQIARDAGADEILIAIPSAPGAVVRQVVELAREAGLPCQTMPGLTELVDGSITVSRIREPRLEDLLRREPVRLDDAGIARCVNGRTVMITGAGGSIGSELVRQVVRFSPGRLVLVGRGEGSLFNLSQDLAELAPGVPREVVVTDVRNRNLLDRAFRRFEPSLVLHAAAHKHVPMMEGNVFEAVSNNVGGVRTVAELAYEHDVERFVNISTDKAVNPTSVMGATKRVGEILVQHVAARGGDSGRRFVSVRFGNVLGSRGSVVHVFQRQIQNGDAITITHPDMARYFMTIPEASQLVLQTASLDCPGEVFVLDMGDPVRIVDIARDLIRFHGKVPDQDVRIDIVGVRPGEKLNERLFATDELRVESPHRQIQVAQPARAIGRGRFTSEVEALLRIAEEATDVDGLLQLLCDASGARLQQSFTPATSSSSSAHVAALTVATPDADAHRPEAVG